MKTERVFTCLFIIGIVLRILHVQGSAIILTVSLAGLSIAYITLSWNLFADKDLKTQNLLLSIVGGLIFLSIPPLGILFKLLHWRENRAIISIGFLLISIFLIMVVIIKDLNKKQQLKTYYKNLYMRTIVLFAVTALVLVTPQYALAYLEYWNDPVMKEIATKHYTDPGDPDYRQQYFKYKEKYQHTENRK